MRLRALLLAALSALSFPVVTGAWGGHVQDESSFVELARRWQDKTPAERELLRERFRRLDQMPEEERAELSRRARIIRRSEASFRQGLPKELREELSELSPHERRERLRSRWLEHSRTVGRERREHLPLEWRRRLEEASPEERWRVLGSERRRRCDDFVERLGRGKRLSEAELEELSGLEGDERLRKLLEIKRRLLVERFEAEGLPPTIDEERWRAMRSYSDEEFLRELRSLRPRRDGFRRHREESGRRNGSERDFGRRRER